MSTHRRLSYIHIFRGEGTAPDQRGGSRLPFLVIWWRNIPCYEGVEVLGRDLVIHARSLVLAVERKTSEFDKRNDSGKIFSAHHEQSRLVVVVMTKRTIG